MNADLTLPCPPLAEEGYAQAPQSPQIPQPLSEELPMSEITEGLLIPDNLP